MDGFGLMALGAVVLGVAWWRWRTPRDPAWQVFGATMRDRESRASGVDRGVRSLLLGAGGVCLLIAGFVRVIGHVV